MSANKKFPTLLILTITVVLGALGIYSYKQGLITPAPADINIIGNGIAPEVSDGPATITGFIQKSSGVGEEGIFVLISSNSGALYELDVKGIDNLVGTPVTVNGTVFSPEIENEAPILYVSAITPIVEN